MEDRASQPGPPKMKVVNVEQAAGHGQCPGLEADILVSVLVSTRASMQCTAYEIDIS